MSGGAHRSCRGLIENSSDYLRSKTVPNCIQVQIMTSFSVERAASIIAIRGNVARIGRELNRTLATLSPAPVKDILGRPIC